MSFPTDELVFRREMHHVDIDVPHRVVWPWLVAVVPLLLAYASARVVFHWLGVALNPGVELIAPGIALGGVLRLWRHYKTAWRKTSLRLTPHQLVVRGWLGKYLSRPQTMTIPIRGLSVSWFRTDNTDGALAFDLQIQPPGGPNIHISSVTCEENDLRWLRAHVEEMQGHAERRHGEGDAEIPDELGVLRDRRTRESTVER